MLENIFIIKELRARSKHGQVTFSFLASEAHADIFAEEFDLPPLENRIIQKFCNTVLNSI